MTTQPSRPTAKRATCQADIDAMTEEEARQWLIANDREAATYWAELPAETDFKAAVRDNCRDFGFDKAAAPAESSLKPFDSYEISPCRRLNDKGQPDPSGSIYEVCEPQEAHCWTLYGHIPGEGVEAIGDFATREDAEATFQRITGIPFAETSVVQARLRVMHAGERLLGAVRGLLDQLAAIGIPDWHGAEGLCLEESLAAIAEAEAEGSMSQTPNLNAPWSLHFDRDGTEDVAIICDSNGEELVRSRHFWRPEGDDPTPPTLAAMRTMHAAPKLLAACRLVVERWERGDLAEAASACQEAIAEATDDSVGRVG